MNSFWELIYMKHYKRDAAAIQSATRRRPLQYCAALFLAPMVASFCIGFIWPFCQGLFLSFTKFKTTSKWTWIGIDNYVKAFADESFRYSFGYTAMYAIVSLVLINVLAFAVAYALTQKIKGANLFRTVFFMPNLIGGIVLGYIWNILINGVLSKLAQPLLQLNTDAGFWGIIILLCWQQIGYMMIIYIAGLQNVPPDLLEAASIDGATPIQQLIKIKIPMVMSSITICLFLTLTNAFKLFDQNLALTGGEPNHMTELLALNIYNTFYTRSGPQWKGIGQAKAVIFAVVVVVIALVQLKATRSKEVQA